MGPASATGPVLLCFDGSDSAQHAIVAAGALLGGGRALVLNVWDPVEPSLFTPMSDAMGSASGLTREFQQVAADVAAERAAEGVRLAQDAGFDAEPLVECGRPRDAIVRVAHDRSPRVVVLGSRGLGGAESVLLGSVSTAVLHHCRGVPLLVVPPGSIE